MNKSRVYLLIITTLLFVATTSICVSCDENTSLEEEHPEFKDVPVYQPNTPIEITVDVENDATFEECFFFNPGDTIVISFMVTNNSSLTTSDKIVLRVSEPDGQSESIEVEAIIEPGKTVASDFTDVTTLSSKLGTMTCMAIYMVEING